MKSENETLPSMVSRMSKDIQELIKKLDLVLETRPPLLFSPLPKSNLIHEEQD